jgi:hypothetical protein
MTTVEALSQLIKERERQTGSPPLALRVAPATMKVFVAEMRTLLDRTRKWSSETYKDANGNPMVDHTAADAQGLQAWRIGHTVIEESLVPELEGFVPGAVVAPVLDGDLTIPLDGLAMRFELDQIERREGI